MTTPRSLLVAPENARDYHLVSRCVQIGARIGECADASVASVCGRTARSLPCAAGVGAGDADAASGGDAGRVPGPAAGDGGGDGRAGRPAPRSRRGVAGADRGARQAAAGVRLEVAPGGLAVAARAAVRETPLPGRCAPRRQPALEKTCGRPLRTWRYACADTHHARTADGLANAWRGALRCASPAVGRTPTVTRSTAENTFWTHGHASDV